ncbi:hypothetical protein ACHQM5_024100 [Ranunculus cassubicifolius]
MEADSHPSPQPGYPVDNEDAKYISGLSTMMVATIQEMKDRISQMEYIFCGQLYPNFQSRPKKMQKRFAETMKTAEDSWKKKEIQYVLEINELQFENKNALEENQKLEEKQKVLEENQKRFAEIMKAAEDSWNKKEIQYVIQLSDLELEKKNALEENQELEQRKKVLEESQKAGDMKVAEEVWKKKEAEFLNQIEELEIGMKKSLQENQKLVASIEEKTKSIIAAKDDWKWRETFLHSEIEGLRNEKQITLEEKQALMESFRKEKTKVENLQSSQELAELQSQLTQKAEEVTAGLELQKHLWQQIELKDIEITTEKKKRRDVVDSYKKLKSQYNFLCNKFGLNTENSLPNSRMEEESFTSKPPPIPKTTQGQMDENKHPSWVSMVDDIMKVSPLLNKQNDIPSSISDRKSSSSTSKPSPYPKIPQRPIEGLQHTNGLASTMSELKKVSTLSRKQNSDTTSPSSSSSRRLKGPDPVSAKSESLSGTKRPASHWRETRTNQEAGGDFLDTPLEIVKEKLSKSSKAEEAHDFPVPPPNDMDFNSSDDETQDLMNTDFAPPFVQPGPQKLQISITKPGDKNFKYVEPVRKKSDRDNLKGFECKQCQKFYDAVLPENSKNGETGTFRCEHHDGVSRHRYKYVPPMTPEGFWNIGFESEM